MSIRLTGALPAAVALMVGLSAPWGVMAQVAGAEAPAPAATQYTVREGDTVFSIARELKPDTLGATMDQMVWALVRLNPNEFLLGPSSLAVGATLRVPTREEVLATSVADASTQVAAGLMPEAQAYLQPQAAGVVTAATVAPSPPSAVEGPAPAAPAMTPEPPVAPPPAPHIIGVELLPAVGKESRQDLAISGTGFAPGLTIEFFEVARKRATAPRAPRTVTANRIEYAAAFGARPARWRVTVRNADGLKSAPFEFEASRGTMLVLTPDQVKELAEATAPPLPPPTVTEPVVAAAPALPPATFQGSEDERNAAALLAAKRPAEAYAALTQREAWYAGDPYFDYLLGVAALDSGKPSEAVFSLLRCLAVKPGFAGARMELARAYFELGDNEDARGEFEQLSRESPPPDARDAIDSYLAAVNLRSARYRPLSRAQLEAFSGYDSNANGGTDAQTFGIFLLSSNTRATESSYYGASGQLFHTTPLAPRWHWQAGGRALVRENPSAQFVDSAEARLLTAVSYVPGDTSFSAGVSGALGLLDGESNHVNYGVDLAASQRFAQDWRVSASGRVAALRYEDSLTIQDVDQVLGGVALGWELPTAQRVDVELGPVVGHDEAVATGSPYGRDFYGARLGLHWLLPVRALLGFNAGWLEAAYDDPGAWIPGIEREDRQWSAQLAADLTDRLRPWRLRVQATTVNNSSNVVLFDYDKVDVGVFVGREL